MDTKSTKLASSLNVPCVKELVAKARLGSVPSRYLRHNQDLPVVVDASLHQVPVVDMQKLLSKDFVDSELQKLHSACKEWGFFQLVNHGVSSPLIERLKLEIHRFFDLKMDEKKKFWQKPDNIEGFGQACVVSEEQKLDWGDLFFMVTRPIKTRKPHLFPNLPSLLRDSLETYTAELKILSMKILNLMAKALKMEANNMMELFEDGRQSVRMNYYPPCPQPELVMGLNAHSDAAGLAILLQINETEGLQIKKDTNWVPIKPLPKAFIVNIGDTLEIVTNGVYSSVEHRATVNPKHERLSIGTFYSPELRKEIGPAPSLVTPETPAMFRRIKVGDYMKGYFSRELRGKSYMDCIRIAKKDGVLSSTKTEKQ